MYNTPVIGDLIELLIELSRLGKSGENQRHIRQGLLHVVKRIINVPMPEPVQIPTPLIITKAQENAIAQSAMSMKRKGLEPSVSAVIAQRPQATLNPETEEPFTSKVILEVFHHRMKFFNSD